MIRVDFRMLALAALAVFIACPQRAGADGMAVKKVRPPGEYAGSLEERAQEAMIIFQGSKVAGGAV